MKKIIFLLISIVVFSSCKKEEEDPIAPVLEFKSISSTSVVQFDNSIVVTFGYEDYQGDLGHQDPDIVSLRVKDARLDEADMYHIPPMTPEEQELHIKGTYSVNLNHVFLLGNGASETTKFTIQIQDRAGNWSNEVVTPVVTIEP
jgi:hypothetical protein